VPIEITFAEATSPGTVRPVNEDCLGSSLATTPEEKRSHGFLLLVADGVSGSGRGAEASQTAIKAAQAKFKESSPLASPKQVLRQLFTAANLAVYDLAFQGQDRRPATTTLTAAILRDDEITIGHVGDCRATLISGQSVQRITSDHSYAGLQVQMGFISEEESMNSNSRYQLTRSLGHEPFIKIDLASVRVAAGDVLVLSSDGLHGSVTEAEVVDTVRRFIPADACRRLVELAEKRGSVDNISVQIARVERIERVAYFRGAQYYLKDDAPPLRREAEVGKVLDERFELVSVLSEGGMATVYRAQDRSSGQTVALKIPFMRFESDPGASSRFEREEKIGLALRHPSLLQFVPVERKSRPYIVMEYLEGQTLAQLLRQVKPLPVQDATRIASRLCEALEYMHENGVVHRDLKPQNIMIVSDGSLRIMDFGIARSTTNRKLTFAGFTPAMGTPDYMAPEQVLGQSGTERTDVYSLGAILYEMVTGRTPYQGDNAFMVMTGRLSGDPLAPRSHRPDIPPALEETILHAMERDPAERYVTVTGFKSDLDHPELVRLTGRADRLKPPKPWKSQWRRIRIVVIGVLAVLGFFSLMYIVSHGEKGKPRPPQLGR